jgi:gluconolactonase
MAEPEIVVGDLQSPYGLAFDADDVLFVSEAGANRVTRIEDGRADPFAQTGPRPLGIAFDDSGDLFVAESGRHHLILISPDEAVEVYAHSCKGRRFARPHQLCFAPTGDVLFSDAGHGDQTDDGCVYRADLDGEVSEIVSGLSSPAGMVLSEDAEVLFVSERGQNRIVSLEIDDDGQLQNQQVFVQFDDSAGAEALLFDAQGQLYASRPGHGITVVDPEGKVAETITLPGDQVAGMTFGGIEFDQLFVAESAVGAIYRLALQVAGQRPFAGPRSV